jgi:hypothetical protein
MAPRQILTNAIVLPLLAGFLVCRLGNKIAKLGVR